MELALGRKETDFASIEKDFQDLVNNRLDLDNCVYKGDDQHRLNDLIKLIDSNRKQSACVSCPHLGNCPQLKWDKNQDMVRVTGCSRHPDQGKFLGHSTTVNVYTDITYNFGPSNEGIAVWATCYGAAAAITWRDQIYCNPPPTGYSIARIAMKADTQIIPDVANITSAIWNFYVVSKTDTDASYILCCTDSTRVFPSVPQALGDYLRTQYDTFDTTNQKNVSAIATGAFNTLTFNTALINKYGNTKWTIRNGRDYGNSAPTGINLMHWKYYTDNFGYVAVTYDDVSPVVPHLLPSSWLRRQRMTVVN